MARGTGQLLIDVLRSAKTVLCEANRRSTHPSRRMTYQCLSNRVAVTTLWEVSRFLMECPRKHCLLDQNLLGCRRSAIMISYHCDQAFLTYQWLRPAGIGQFRRLPLTKLLRMTNPCHICKQRTHLVTQLKRQGLPSA